MPIEFRCSGCSKLLRTPDESAGKKARCPDCGTIVDVPAAGAAPAGAAPSGAGPSGVSPSGGSTPNANPFEPAPPGPGPSFPPPPSNPFQNNPYSDGGGGASAARPMGENPYAAPRMSPPPAASALAGGPLEHRKVTIEQLLTTTWEVFKPQIGMGIVLGLVMMGLGGAVSIVSTPINLGAQATGEISIIIAGQIVAQLVSFFAQTWIQLGAMNTVLHWARTGSIDIAKIFQVGPIYARGLGLFFLTQLIILGIILVCMIPLLALIPSKNEQAMIIAGIAGGLVAMPVVVWVTLKLFLSTMFLVDRNVPVMEAFSLSNRFMAGNKGTVFLSGIVVGLCGMTIVVCTCFLGILVFAPFASLYTGVTYLLITGQPVLIPGRYGQR